MSDAVSHRYVEVNGVRLHIAEQGEGPLVLLLHGFPECWYSWRHQFEPLAAAGYRVVAPDQRGYARSDQPERIDAYTMLHLTGDVVGLIHALGERQAVVVGHDWGAPVAWSTALLRPDLVRGVAGLSVPPTPRGTLRPLSEMRAKLGDDFYQVHFQEPGVADAEYAADIAGTFRGLLTAASGDSPTPMGVVAEGGSATAAMPRPERLPGWLTEADIEVFVGEYARHGERAFTGGLNWYRNIDRSWELLAAFDSRVIEVPALYMAGDRDLVMAFPGMDELLPSLPEVLPGLHRSLILPGCGHWTQQERPDEVNAALLDFLGSLPEES
ncbi:MULTISPECIES: alpha/beta fold hydrolase [Streptomyces]|uniref:alpha/beta fold hydrolase n=1 Tax=Streptomyces TaxID=1883 RepID=UPI00163BB56A|nr:MULTISPECIES: alpha/beta hydrolase [Streptomyces]MBC2876061.1 alpha/beta hydrolase [Streptomyces sp. TYQ1024]UBI38421.1 alpha/beta hydrolase [Streptomyces mobaraensis]UKW31006.1 alpha/beta hydrolase [Streptomyces sp. TYQ1024]